jgi:hypothetical protein
MKQKFDQKTHGQDGHLHCYHKMDNASSGTSGPHIGYFWCCRCNYETQESVPVSQIGHWGEK